MRKDTGGPQQAGTKADQKADRRVLVVDDSKSIRAFLQQNLDAAGYAVSLAENGEEALAALAADPVDLVISDIHMPVLDGRAFRARMLELPELAAIPFLVMSTDDSEENVRIMREMRVSAFLTKPFKADQAIMLVERLLDYTQLLVSARQEMEDKERDMLLSSIMSLAQALDARDKYTRTHSDSVAETAKRMVRRMGLGPEMAERAHIAGRLHDIGKVGIPDSILQKPGRLTDEEFAVIKTHPDIGADILGPIPSLSEVAEIIRSHHEHFDGSGYPRGLAGEAIPLLARIMAVADILDALTSDRPYRKGMPLEQALEIMAKCRDRQLCPVCLDAFLADL